MPQHKKDIDTLSLNPTQLHELALDIAKHSTAKKLSHKQLEKYTTKFLTDYFSAETIINRELDTIRSNVSQRHAERSQPTEE
jgi:hypothetical protein